MKILEGGTTLGLEMDLVHDPKQHYFSSLLGTERSEFNGNKKITDPMTSPQKDIQKNDHSGFFGMNSSSDSSLKPVKKIPLKIIFSLLNFFPFKIFFPLKNIFFSPLKIF